MKEYYHHSDVVLGEFIQFPLALMELEEYKSLTCECLVLYGVMLRRFQLSIKNHWTDENSRIYMYFSREEMCECLRISMNTVIKTVKKLKEVELLEEIRQGQGKPNRLYLLKPRTNMMEELFSDNKQYNQSYVESKNISQSQSFQSSKNQSSRLANFTGQDTQYLHPKEKYKKEIYLDNISPHPPHRQRDDMAMMINSVRESVDYKLLIERYDSELIDFIIDIIADIRTSSWTNIKIGCKYYDADIVRQVFSKVNHNTVLHVINALETAGKIANKRAYIISVIFNYGTSDKVVMRHKKEPVKKNSFNDFEQRTYDYDLLMEQIRDY